MVVDESLFEFNGDCPIKRSIHRKPHLSGLLVYCLAGYFSVDGHQIPYVLDFEPNVLDNFVGPQDAMISLYNRLRERKPTPHPHLVVDSAFGSFAKLREIINTGGNATMSMPGHAKAWLWELLDYKCGINEGRLAVLPVEGVVISSFKVLTESGHEHQIRTISSGCILEEDPAEEETISRIIQRRDGGHQLEYLTEFLDGHSEWLGARFFIDDDGVVNLAWLHFVNTDDLHAAFESYTLTQLKVPSPPCLSWLFL